MKPGSDTSTRICFFLLLAVPLLLAVSRAAADISVTLIAVFFLLRCRYHRNWQWLHTPDIAMLAAFWCWLVASSAIIHYDTSSLKDATAAVRFLLLYAAMRFWLLSDRKRIIKAGFVLGCTLGVLALDTTIQYFTGTSLTGRANFGGRLTGPMSHPNIGNLFLKIGFFATGIGFIIFRKAIFTKKILFGAAVCWLTALIVVSGERSITLLLFLGFALLLAGLFLKLPHWRLRLGMACAAFITAFGVLYATQSIVQNRTEQLGEQLSVFPQTPYGQLFQGAYHVWRSHPLAGVGLKQYREQCWMFKPAFGLTYCDLHPHNIYLEVLSESGGIGFVLFTSSMILFYLHLFRNFRKAKGRRAVPAVFALALAGVLLFPVIVTQSLFTNWPAMLFWYSLGLAAALGQFAKRSARSEA